MSNRSHPEAGETLSRLIAEYLSEDIDVARFCENYEAAWNEDLNLNQLSKAEFAIFSSLFDDVVHFSEFAADRAAYTVLRGPMDIQRAAEFAQSEWNILANEPAR